ncbi:MAG: sensor histidine kinase [Ancrocorticia sp.]|uniref:sensor histidine kinase n=1 Tax=Ancrocorticia sp. TaxID=2593684 RepID=UPI003F9168CD
MLDFRSGIAEPARLALVGWTTMEDYQPTANPKDGRHAEAISGFAMFGLSLGVGVLTLVLDDPTIPLWLWATLLFTWFVSIVVAGAGIVGRAAELLFFACAVLASWALLLTADANGMIMLLLITVVGVGSYLLAMPWMVALSLVNCLLLFGHVWLSSGNLSNAAIFAVFYFVLHIAVVFSSYAQLREVRLRAELEQKNLELEAASMLLEDSVAGAERLRISRELHDLIGHQLTVLNLELEAAKHLAGGEHVERASAVAKDLLSDVRATVGQLRETHPADLRASLQRLAHTVPSLDIHVDVTNDAEIDQDMTATLIRAAQEIITNTIKHAQATELSLHVEQGEGTVTLTGTNNGTAPRTITPGHGLTGLEERLNLVGAVA